MRTLLWVGDAVVSSGFARATHKTLKAFHESGEWNVYVLGINYFGDPHEYPYPIYPAMGMNGDPFGTRRTAELAQVIRPDVIIVQQDTWNFPPYLKAAGNVPVIGAVAVDGFNVQGRSLNGLAHAIFWTEFGQKQAHQGGYVGGSSVIPLGVDLSIYSPMYRQEARNLAGLPDRIHDAYVVGNVNRNQPRKRLDLTIAYFAAWVKEYKRTDAYLYLHVAPTGEDAFDCAQLMRYYNLSSRFINSVAPLGYGVPERAMPVIYNSFDVMFTTTQGEGMGLPTLEGMACGIPQICPDWSALGEWARPAARLVPCNNIAVTPGQINIVGGIMDLDEAVLALDELYSNRDMRLEMGKQSLALAENPYFNWDRISVQFKEQVEDVLTSTPTRA